MELESKKKQKLKALVDYIVKQLKRVDRITLIAVFTLSGIGMLMIYSITSTPIFNNLTGASADLLVRTMESVVIGILGMLLFLLIPYHIFKRYLSPLTFIGTVALLVLTLVVGRGTAAAPDVRRWIYIGGRTFQPSEFARMGLIIAVAWFIGRLVYHQKYYTKKIIGWYLAVLAYIVLCGALIIGQLDLGSALVVLGVGGVMFVSSGIGKKQIFLLALVGIVGVSLLGLSGLVQYQQRLDVWRDPFYHDFGRQSVMGYISIAQGGMFGRGLGESIQKYGFAIEAHTDLIITILAEELGVATVILVMALYFLIAIRCFRAALKGKDLFGSLICIGIGSFFLIQPLINLGGAGGVIPLSGVTLPLISYGGTSIIATFLMIGMYLNVQAKSKEQLELEASAVQKEEKSAKVELEKVIPFQQAK